MGQERRSEERLVLGPNQFGPLWLVAHGTAGAPASIRDVSLHGLCVVLNRQQAPRVAAALLEAKGSGIPIDVTRIPRHGSRRAHVAWVHAPDAAQTHFGLALVDPLDVLVAELRQLAHGGGGS